MDSSSQKAGWSFYDEGLFPDNNFDESMFTGIASYQDRDLSFSFLYDMDEPPTQFSKQSISIENMFDLNCIPLKHSNDYFGNDTIGMNDISGINEMNEMNEANGFFLDRSTDFHSPSFLGNWKEPSVESLTLFFPTNASNEMEIEPELLKPITSLELPYIDLEPNMEPNMELDSRQCDCDFNLDVESGETNESEFWSCVELEDDNETINDNPKHSITKNKRSRTNHTWKETAQQLQLDLASIEMKNYSIPGKQYVSYPMVRTLAVRDGILRVIAEYGKRATEFPFL